MLTISKNKILTSDGKEILLTGIALGGWTMMEGYMLGGSNIPETKFKDQIETSLGKNIRDEFSIQFRERFITPIDAKRMADFGFNCVRIPFNYRLIENKPDGMDFLVNAIKMFTDENLYVILDMHAVPGSQNKDWHSDSSGEALFYTDKSYQDRYVNLWKQLSDIFKNNDLVAGYDIMNEPVTDRTDIVEKTYRRVIETIRKNGDNHIIFLEGNMWAQQIDFLDNLIQLPNIALSVHFYEPSKFTFKEENSTTGYPGEIDSIMWDKKHMIEYLSKYAKKDVPVYVGEFGVSTNCKENGLSWVKDALDCFKHLGFHYTYWTYKSAAPMAFPDGLFQLFDKSLNMDNAVEMLKKDAEYYYCMLDTTNFSLREDLLNILVDKQ